MSTPELDESKLPKKCRDELAAIEERNQSRMAQGWKPFLITDDCLLHLFIKREHWPEGHAKPLAAAFGKVEMSVESANGPFGPISKKELKRRLLKVSAATNQDFVGAVAIPASKVYSDELLKFVIKHDPNPATNSLGQVVEQSDRHSQIVCEKQQTTRRERLREICEPSLLPSELEAIDVSEEPRLEQVRTAKLRTWLWLPLLLGAISLLILIMASRQ